MGKEMQDAYHWRLSPKEAIGEQRRLQKEVRIQAFQGPLRTIAGVDVSLERFGSDLYAGIVVLSYPDLELVESAVAKVKVEFPYIPGLLSFREIPGILESISKLRTKPDLIMVDGQGIAHPRRLGIASHLGIVSGIPTIGCAKSRLYGDYNVPKEGKTIEKITDPRTGEHLGFAFASKPRSNPIIISPGHLVGVDEALSIVRSCLCGYRLPEPTRRAHLLVNAFRKGEGTFGAISFSS